MTGRVDNVISGHRLLFLMTAACVFVTLGILVFMLVLGLPLLTPDSLRLIFASEWAPDRGLFGVLPFIYGTLAIVSLSLLFAVPLSLGNAVLIHLLLPPAAAGLLHRLIKMMTGIPTVIYGFVGIFLLVPFIREWSGSGSGMSILSAGLLLALLISPTMILIFVESFAAVPAGHIRALTALGGSLRQRLFYLLLPGARNGIMTGIILGIGRALGDTMIALMVAGNATARPESLLDPVRTLTAQIALVMAADLDSIEFKTIFVCGILLYLWAAVLTLTLRFLNHGSVKSGFRGVLS